MVSVWSCSNPSEPVNTFSLELTADQTEAWVGETVHFSVKTPAPLPEGACFRWSISGAYQPERSAELHYTFTNHGTLHVIVEVINNPSKTVKFTADTLSLTVHQVTGRLDVMPERLLWDAGYEYVFTAVWGSRPPVDYKMRWNFGDGTETVNTGSMTCAHVYEKVGAYTLRAEILTSGDSVLGSDQVQVEITAPTPGRYLRVEFREALFNYNHRTTGYDGSSWTSTSDSLVIRCDSTLIWDGEHFSFNVRQYGYSYGYIGRYTALEIYVEGRISGNRLTAVDFRKITSSHYLIYDSSYTSFSCRDIHAKAGSPGVFQVTGEAGLTACLTGLQYHRVSNRLYPTGMRYSTLGNWSFNTNSFLKVTFSHAR